MSKKIELATVPFGQIISISGLSITIRVDNNYAERLEQQFKGETYNIGTVGEIFMIGGPSVDDRIHYAIFDEVKLVSNYNEHLGNESTSPPTRLNDGEKAIILAKVIGYQDISQKDRFQFRRGVGHYPKFNSKCYLLTQEEKRSLFHLEEQGLFIGKTPDANNEKVAIKLDKFLNKHSVILGSTGSGKSCTVASIFQKILGQLEYSHIVFFDLHDEYSQAFPVSHFNVNKTQANQYYLPYWFLNFEEFQAIFLGDIDYSKNSQGLRILKDQIIEFKKRSHEAIRGDVGDIHRININSPLHYSFDLLLKELKHLNKRTLYKSDGKSTWNSETNSYEPNSGSSKVKRIDKDEQDQCIQDPNYYGELNGIIEKLESIRDDKRYQFLFPNSFDTSTTFYVFIEQILSIPDKKGIQTQISIFDLSKIPSEITPIIIGVMSRLCFEYKLWDENPHKLPIYLILEEAHNYIPNEVNAITKLPTKYIGRIAKEGRKYGISQLIISQRPSDLSSLIVSQCSNFFVLRVTNPSDQAFILNVLPDHLNSLASMIPFFQNGECLIAGELVEIPVRVLIDKPKFEPNSGDVSFSAAWKKTLDDYNVESTIHKWWEISE